MFSNDLSQYLPFASRFRGNSSTEVLNSIISRYNKVVEDSSDSNSDYRKGFAAPHRLAVKYLSDSEHLSSQKLSFIMRSLRMNAAESVMDAYNIGYIDALSVIILELETVADRLS